MEVDSIEYDWILISAPTPKQRSAPKSIPPPVCDRAPSLEQPLELGGRPAPEFFQTSFFDDSSDVDRATVGS